MKIPNFIFRPIVKSKHGEKLGPSFVPDSVNVSRRSLGFPAGFYGLHTLRAGGATAAANGGIPDRLLRDMAAGNLIQSRMVMSKIP